jgi:hypothetical protein
LRLVNIVVDVAFKLFIDNVELVDTELRLVSIVVDVVLMFGMSKYDCEDKLFKFVLVAYTDKLGIFITVLL